jgi:hypothetical protein
LRNNKTKEKSRIHEMNEIVWSLTGRPSSGPHLGEACDAERGAVQPPNNTTDGQGS